MPTLNNLLKLSAIFTVVILVTHTQSQHQTNQRFSEELEPYTFDYSAHRAPLAYDTYGTALELLKKVKLVP